TIGHKDVVYSPECFTSAPGAGTNLSDGMINEARPRTHSSRTLGALAITGEIKGNPSQAPSLSHPLHLAPGRPAPPSGYLQPASTRTPLALLLCSRDRLGLLPIHIAAQRRGTHPTIKKNNLRVVGKAPCTQLTWQKIHKATGNNNVNPRAGRCRCIFTAGVDAAGEESLGKHCA
ncbi:ATP-dependent RNA helicase DBP9, partial [Dissostichus eleginoides]